MLAAVNDDVLGDALCDVNLASDAGNAHVRGVGLDVGATNATKAAAMEKMRKMENRKKRWRCRKLS